jgi:hypothetical protein
VAEGAKRALLKDERQRFLEGEWPRVYAAIQRLGFSAADLLANPPAAAPASPAEPTPPATPGDTTNT